jgi:hypothetical protein
MGVEECVVYGFQSRGGEYIFNSAKHVDCPGQLGYQDLYMPGKGEMFIKIYSQGFVGFISTCCLRSAR